MCITIAPTFACLNFYYSIDDDGDLHEITQMHQYFKKFNKNFNVKKICKSLPKIEEKLKESGDYKDLSDYAIALMKLGLFEEAKDILVELEFAHPEEYKLASNLGTAYELVGEVDSAIKYINYGMELNSNAHEGSEWVHIKVLETKNHLKEDSTWLENHTVLELSEKQEADSSVLHQIFIQAHERFPFTPGPDSIMASIMVDLADCFAAKTSIEHAKAMYQIAKEHFGDTSAIVNEKINEMLKLRGKYDGIFPERRRDNPREGEHIKIDGIRYGKLIDDNNDPPYEINWEDYETNVDTLLSWVGLEQIDRTPPPIEVLPPDEESVEDVPEEKESNTWLIIAAICCVIPVIGIFIFKKKKSNQE
jgi:tetratricopeptide (TPR) repeat protein